MTLAGRGRRILVVDDDEPFRTALVNELRSEAFEVTEASNGIDALAAVRRDGRPALILLDLWMPAMDGWQVLRGLQASALADIPVVVMTAARSEDTAMLDPAVLGVVAVLEKPFGLPRLLETVRRHL